MYKRQVMLAAGCGGGDSKSSSAAGKGGIPAVIRVGSETTFPPFEFTEDEGSAALYGGGWPVSCGRTSGTNMSGKQTKSE